MSDTPEFPEFEFWIFCGVDAAVTALFYFLYKSNEKAADHVKNAKHVTSGEDLTEELKSLPEQCIAYACVEGKVIPVDKPLRSRFENDYEGVIQRIKLVQHKSKKVEGKWREEEKVLRDKLHTVPFLLRGPNSIYVTQPTRADHVMNELKLTYSQYDSKHSVEQMLEKALGENEIVKGYHESEKMLLVNTLILGIGELVLERGRIKLIPPRSGAAYILTTMSKRGVISQLEGSANWFRAAFCIFAGIGTGALVILATHYYEKWRNGGRGPRQEQADSPVDCLPCMVCATRPRDVVLLNCGHTCICGHCSEMLTMPRLCPMCQQTIERVLPIYKV